jgi:hypothetical protein
MDNVMLRKSNLIINTQFGGRYALEIDYTKAFLRNHQIYYRLFPYIREDNLYEYDDQYHRIGSHRINEYGITFGVGFHFLRNLIVEPYLYSYQIEHKRAIGAGSMFENYFTSSGVGIKVYSENLDAYPYYTRGYQFFTKYSASKDSDVSDVGYNKWVGEVHCAIPIHQRVSLLMSAEWGTFFDSEPVLQDPFYIGGIDSFLGLHQREILAPHFRKLSLGVRTRLYQNLFVDMIANYINFGDVDIWPEMDNTIMGYGVVLGYNTVFGPLRAGFAVNDDHRYFSYVSIGYDFDAFKMSRR